MSTPDYREPREHVTCSGTLLQVKSKYLYILTRSHFHWLSFFFSKSSLGVKPAGHWVSSSQYSHQDLPSDLVPSLVCTEALKLPVER